MNVQLSNVLSDISGVSGMHILQAILDGERNPWKLAALVTPGVRATPEEIAKSLEGNWRPELLFVLRQQVELYGTYQKKICDGDLALRQHLESMGSKVDRQRSRWGPSLRARRAAATLPNLICVRNCIASPVSTGPKSAASMW